MSDKPKLAFRQDQTFTIVQVTDVHNSGTSPLDARSLALIEAALEQEQPDLVVFTGDLIRKGPDPRAQFREVTSIPARLRIPYAFVFGNHDSRGDVTREELMAMEADEPYCLARAGDAHWHGVGNYTLTVASSQDGHGGGSAVEDKDERAAWLLYLFDCDGPAPQTARGNRREWIPRDKVDWYIAESKRLGGNRTEPLPALAFFHIPLVEYEELWDFHTCYGHKQAAIRRPNLNVGLFSAMVELGDVVGAFVGHDHSNDFWGELAGIRLCYGRVSGYNGDIAAGFACGVRVIRLHEGRRSFDTWLRLDDGSVVTGQPIHHPQGRPASV